MYSQVSQELGLMKAYIGRTLNSDDETRIGSLPQGITPEMCKGGVFIVVVMLLEAWMA